MVSQMQLLQGPPTVLYEPNFISEEEENRLLDCIYKAPKPKWQYLSSRRLQNWGGLPHPKGMIAEPIPEWLSCYINKIDTLKLFDDKQPNHVLVNEYLPGQGIMPHTDGPLFYPVITTISLGSHTVLNFYENIDEESIGASPVSLVRQRRKVMSVLLKPRSLLVVKEDMYHKHLHAIDELQADEISKTIVNPQDHPVGDVLTRKTRVSVTIRHVPKTTKAKLFLSKK